MLTMYGVSMMGRRQRGSQVVTLALVGCLIVLASDLFGVQSAPTHQPTEGGSENEIIDRVQGNPASFVNEEIDRRDGLIDGDDQGRTRRDQQDDGTSETDVRETTASQGGPTTAGEGTLDSTKTETGRVQAAEYGNVCAICHEEEGETNDEIALGCGHKFHAVCLDDYFLFAQRKEVGIILLY